MRLIVAIAVSAFCIPTDFTAGTVSAQVPDLSEVPAFPVNELSEVLDRLSKSVGMIGQNRVEEAFEQLDTQSNPAFRNPQAYENFHNSWKKLFEPLGRLRLEFEAYDVIAYRRVSTQAYFIYGTANGAQGPAVFDFRVFKYRGKWHVHGFTFRASGWDRDPAMPDDAIILSQPVSYPITDGQVAQQIEVRPPAIAHR